MLLLRCDCRSIAKLVLSRHLRWPGLILVAAISACSTPSYRPTLPESLGNEGVVIGQITDVGALKGFVRGVTLTNGKEIEITHGYFASNLAPGSYEVKHLFTSAYEGANLTRVRTYPLNLPFTVRKNQVTNVGAIVLLPVSNTPEKQLFATSRVDNTKDIPRFFRQFYPQLASSLDLDRVTLAEGKFLDNQKLGSLRRLIITESFGVKKRGLDAANTTQMIVGDLGSFARVRYDAANKIADIDLQEMNTFANIGSQHADPVWKRYFAVTEDQRLFTTENGRFVERALPNGNLRSPSVFPVGEKGLIVADKECDVYVSVNNGTTWTPRPEMKQDKCDRYSAASGSKGYYVYIVNYLSSTSYPAVLYYSPHGQQDFHTLSLPPELTGIRDVKEYAGKIYVKSNRWHKKPSSEGGKTELTDIYFVRNLQGDSWKLLFLPTAACGQLLFSDAQGNSLRVRCGNDEYESKNAGNNWSPLR